MVVALADPGIAFEGSGDAPKGPPRRAPQTLGRDVLPLCDINGDGRDDVLSVDANGGLPPYTLRILSGANGSVLWTGMSFYYLRTSQSAYRAGPGPGFGVPESRPGIAVVPDQNHDGVCDILAVESPETGRLVLLSGATGGRIRQDAVPDVVVDFLDAPEDGAFYLLSRRTNVVRVQPPGFTRPVCLGIAVLETIYRFDVATGAQVWNRSFGRTQPEGMDFLETYLTGRGDLDGDGDIDLAIDHTNKQLESSCESLILNLEAKALDGTTGSTLWERSGLVVLQREACVTDCEGPRENLAVTGARVVADMSRGTTPDVVASYLVEDVTGGKGNGRFRTYFVPLDGRTGRFLWDAERIALTGWGFLSTLTGADAVVAGLVDIATASSGHARFPLKEVRVSVLDAADGRPLWTVSERTSMDNYLASSIALRELYRTPIVGDKDGDGVAEVLIPAQALLPIGVEQELLSTREVVYEVRSGTDGEIVGAARPWGLASQAVVCAPGDLSFASGHGRRIAISSVDVRGNQRWLHSLYNDQTYYLVTLGAEISGFGAQCSPLDDGRRLYAVHAGIQSTQRGSETLSLVAVTDENGTLVWQLPSSKSDDFDGVSLSALAAARALTKARASVWTQDAWMTFAGFFALGLAGRWVRGWTKARRSRPPRRTLEELMQEPARR